MALPPAGILLKQNSRHRFVFKIFHLPQYLLRIPSKVKLNLNQMVVPTILRMISEYLDVSSKYPYFLNCLRFLLFICLFTFLEMFCLRIFLFE